MPHAAALYIFSSLLHAAAASPNAALAAALLSACPPRHASLADDEGWTPLHCAASAGRAGSVHALAGAGGSVDARTSTGRTPLHYAASKGHVDVAKVLLAAGAAVGARPAFGTALARAAP